MYERAFDLSNGRHQAQRRQALSDAERDVRREWPRESIARGVTNPRTPSGLPTCPVSRTTPARRAAQCQIELCRDRFRMILIVAMFEIPARRVQSGHIADGSPGTSFTPKGCPGWRRRNRISDGNLWMRIGGGSGRRRNCASASGSIGRPDTSGSPGTRRSKGSTPIVTAPARR